MNAASVGPEGFRPFDLGGRSSSQVVADRLTGARVVKAFNTLFAAALARASTLMAAGGCCLSRAMTRRQGKKSEPSSIGSAS
jgi:predicted dinucleotide-binding enzyme